MEGTQHVLTGFGDFLERRQVSFVDPLPCSCVCCACGIASSSTVRLPCGHELCRPCHGQSANVCPVDSVKFEEDHVVQQTTDLQQLRVFCINGDCDFVGKLAELSGHVLHCTKDELKCRKCGDHVKRNAAVVHRRQCFVDVGTTSSSPDLAAVVADTETSRGQASPEGHVDQHVGDSSNHVTQDVVVAEASVGAKRTYAGELKRVLPSASYSEETVLRETISGPCRAASEPGVFVTLCKFDNIYEKYAELRRKKATSMLVTGCVAAGYTFSLKCKLAKKEANGEVCVCFKMRLGSGDYDNLVEWPFRKKVTVVLAHPINKEKDISLHLPMLRMDNTKKPAPTPGTYNRGQRTTDDERWEHIESEGFVLNNALHVNVQFSDN